MKAGRGIVTAAVAAGFAAAIALAIARGPQLPQGAPPAVDSGRNVILITWDGVRLDEFLGNPDARFSDGADAPLLPYFWNKLAPTGRIYGDPRQRQAMTVANPSLVSMPAYQSIFTGTLQPCQGNDCDRIARLSFPERIAQDLGLGRRQVATIASWEGLTFSIESHPGSTFVNAGVLDLHDDGGDRERQLNDAQKTDLPPWPDCRYDKYTWEHARRFLDKHRPRFLYISLDDSDGWGHQVNYAKYADAIRGYDQWLEELVAHLETMGDYGRNTCLIVTTDHGRGRGEGWTTHSNGMPYSGLILMYAGCPLAPGPTPFKPATLLTTHLDIRPTVEALFGLAPYDCLLCGHSLFAQPMAPSAH